MLQVSRGEQSGARGDGRGKRIQSGADWDVGSGRREGASKLPNNAGWGGVYTAGPCWTGLPLERAWSEPQKGSYVIHPPPRRVSPSVGDILSKRGSSGRKIYQFVFEPKNLDAFKSCKDGSHTMPANFVRFKLYNRRDSCNDPETTIRYNPQL